MSLFSFDGSAHFAFVGSPHLARNNTTSSVAFIQRILAGDTGEFNQATTVFPSLQPLPAAIHASRAVPLGEPSGASVQLAAGWNRITLLVWGVDNICNPWEAPVTGTYPSVQSPFTVFDDTEEIYLQLGGLTYQDGIPSNRTFLTSTPEARVPLNCVNPAGEFIKSVSLYNFHRTITFSVYANEVTTWVWYSFVGRTRLRNTAYSIGGGLYSFAENVGTFNATRFNPPNPVLFNGTQLNLFHGETSVTTGLGVIVAAVSADTQHRDLEYVDITADPLT